ncbi:MAG: c-type cytochrome [Planctomycetes bacterium]|nr:c-type cytochrome [Planctomycetota bacterium]
MATPKFLAVALLLADLAARLVGQSAPAAGRFVLDADTNITLLRGFDAELLYDVPAAEGSWVAMAFDPKGRLIVSDQDSQGVFRVTLPKAGDTATKVGVESLKGFPYEPIKWGKRTVGGALGFLYAFDSLYMSTMTGFYRIRDTDGDDTYDEFTRIKPLEMGYEHSAHCIVLTEDQKGLYLVSGNHSRVPDGVRSLQPPVWDWDSLLPPLPDPQGHAVGVLAPGGWICRITPDGKDWTMVSSGYRNPVDLAINREGELFTYDSDMEFDVGSPWYRPTRVNHVTSASEFGWRAGSAKWPEYFADGNGSVVDIGPGSPTGMSFGHHSNFPDLYQDKLFLCDWTFGTIYTVELEENGSSYTGTKQEFLTGTPLNVSAMRFGPDGHMYFLVGGRNTASKLYRVRYVGPGQDGPKKSLVANQPLRDLRRSLEAFHGRKDGGVAALDTAWPFLSHADRSIRYAARLAIESQDLASWQDRVFAETAPRAVVHAAIALCRHGDKSLAGRVVAKLNRVPIADLAREDLLALLRAYSLASIRLGPLSPGDVASVVARLDPLYPADDAATDAELCRLLSHLDAPSVVGKTIALMQTTTAKALDYDKAMLARHQFGEAILKAMANTPNSQNIHYAYCLRRVQAGWTLDDRKYFFTWLNDSLQKNGGLSFAGYVRGIRQDAIEHLGAKDAAAVGWLVGDVAVTDLGKLPLPKGPPGAWTVDTATKLFETGLTARNFENGKQMFAAGRCVACHRFQGSGGYSGPDLGSVAKRYSIRDILVAILEPSQSISEQYQASKVVLKEGGALYGRIIYRKDKELALAANPYDFSVLTKMPLDHVETVEPSQVSLMPPATIALMNADEVRDLIAYLVSGGDAKHAVFRKP